MVTRKEYIGFKRGSNFVDIEFQKKQLKIFINMKYGSIPDPMNISRDVSKVGHYGNGEYEIKVNRETDLDYLMLMIKQSYNSKSWVWIPPNRTIIIYQNSISQPYSEILN